MTVQLERPAPQRTEAPTAPPRAAWLGFAVVLAAGAMNLLDSTIAQTAAPAIQATLGGTYADIEWITAAYTLAMAVSLLVGGRLGDVFGRSRVVLVGFAGFGVASLLCALAPTMETLIAARVVQGAVGAIMLPQVFGLIRELFGDEHQQRAFAILGPVMGMTAVVGPVVGGALVDLDLAGLGWRTIFLVNLPISATAVWFGLKHLPTGTRGTAQGIRIDAASVLMAAAGTFALVYPIVEGRELDWPAWGFALMAGGVALLALFGRRQVRLARAGGRAPLFEPSILRSGKYVAGLALVLCFIGAMGGMILVLNVMFQAGMGFSPLASGAATVAIPVAAIFGSITSSMLLERLGRTTIHIGTATMALGLVAADLVLRAAGGGLSAWELAPALALAGFGMGMVFVPMFDVILAGVEPHQLGSASGLLEAVQQFATSIGIAVVGTVLFGVVGAAGGADAFVGAADDALLVAAGFLIAAFLVAFKLPRHAR